MLLFSQRKGIRPLKKSTQREAMDGDLRNRLWSALHLCIWNKHRSYKSYDSREDVELLKALTSLLWVSYFKYPLDTMPDFAQAPRKSALQIMREYFFKAEWSEVYDFLEFVIRCAPEPWAKDLADLSNTFLEDENAAYRVVNREIVEITDEHEIGAIESALSSATSGAATHLSRALELLSDRRSHDYPNSIKESISAVEAVAQTISGMPDASLGECLGPLTDKGCLHRDFRQVLGRLYGYASNEGGIRHARSDDTTEPSFADAKFMLVVCSSYVHYLVTRAAELGMCVN